MQNELLTAKSNVLRSLNSSSNHERAITSLTTEYEIKLAGIYYHFYISIHILIIYFTESAAKITQLENKVHEFDAIAKVLDVPPNSDLTSKVSIKSTQDLF